MNLLIIGLAIVLAIAIWVGALYLFSLALKGGYHLIKKVRQ